jgi:hypothetical protein
VTETLSTRLVDLIGDFVARFVEKGGHVYFTEAHLSSSRLLGRKSGAPRNAPTRISLHTPRESRW